MGLGLKHSSLGIMAIFAVAIIFMIGFSNHDAYADYLSQFGSVGSGNGQFNNPSGIAFDSSGNIYVTDQTNHRVQKFNSAGTYLSQFGSLGSGHGQFNAPNGIALDSSGNIYVADNGNNRVEKFNSAGVYQSQFGSLGSGNGQFSSPAGIAFDISGNGQFNVPSNIALDSGGNITVTDAGNNRVEVFNSAGVFQTKFGTNGSGAGKFNAPRDIVIDSSHNIYVADFNNGRVEKFNTFGTFLNLFGSVGSGNGQFIGPHGLALDSSGNIYVTDYTNDRVEKFDPSENFLGWIGNCGSGTNCNNISKVTTSFCTDCTTLGSSGSGNGQFIHPTDVVLDSFDNIYVVDSGNNRVEVFNSAGVFQTKFGSLGPGPGQRSNPFGIAIDSSGSIYVAEYTNDRVQEFNSAGVYQSQFGSLGSNPGQFNAPGGIAFDSSGNIYVADSQNHRVQKFGPPPPRISITSANPATPVWGVDLVSVSGTATTFVGTDTISVDWGDGTAPTVISAAASWGPVTHTYGSGAIATNPNNIVATLKSNTNFVKATSTPSPITVQPHPTTITLNNPSSVVNGTTFSALGKVTDNTNGSQIATLPVAFNGTMTMTILTDAGSGVTLGKYSTTGVTFSGITGIDTCVACFPANVGVLHMGIGGTITLPGGAKIVGLELQEMGTNHVVLTATQSDGQTFTQTADGQGPSTENVGLVAGNDINKGLPAFITSIQITDVSGTGTVGISKLEASDPRGLPPTLRSITFTTPFSPAATQTFNPGGYNFIVTAPNSIATFSFGVGFAGNSLYAGSLASSSFVTVANQFGVLGEGTLQATSDTGTGYKSLGTCASTASDGICDDWKNNGIPYNVGGVAKRYTLAGATINQKDIYVESDSMVGHQPTTAAINKVVTAFTNSGVNGVNGIKLIVDTGDTNIPHVSNINVWTDGNQNQGNDFDSIKANYFGTASERTTVSGSAETDNLNVVTANSVYNDVIHGITMTTTNPTNSTITVKQVITETVASAITAGTITPSVGTSCNGVQFVTNNRVGPVTVSFSGTGTSRALTITMLVYNSAGVSGATLCDVTIPLTFTTTQNGAPTVAKGGPAAGPNSASPVATNTLLMAKAQVYHYLLWVHSIGNCGPSGVAEGGTTSGGNDIVVGLGCDFGTSATESPVPGDAATDSGIVTITQTLTLSSGSIITVTNPPVIDNQLAHLTITSPTATPSAGISTTKTYTITVTLPVATASGYFVNGAIGSAIHFPLTIITQPQNPVPTITGTSVYVPNTGSAGQLTGTEHDTITGNGPSYTDTISGLVFTGGHWATTGSDNQMAGTFMHELGHNLGLLHGGPASGASDAAINCKPNYPSVMSYTRQMDTYLTGNDFVLDYSHNLLPSLTENNGLLEANGLQGTALSTALGFPKKVVYGDGNGHSGIGTVAGSEQAKIPIDWGLDSDISADTATESVDINNLGIPGCNTAESPIDATYNDYNDWANLVYSFRGSISLPFDGADDRPIHQAPARLADYPAAVVRDIFIQTSQQPVAVYVSDSGNNRIEKFTNAGAFVSTFGSKGSGNSQFNIPLGIAADSSGNIYVSDSGNNRIEKFTNAGVFITKFGSSGTGNGKFKAPLGIAADSSGNIYVSDSGNNRIEKFTNAGVFITKFGSSGTGNGQFNTPSGIASAS